jgi:hypothetical protein
MSVAGDRGYSACTTRFDHGANRPNDPHISRTAAEISAHAGLWIGLFGIEIEHILHAGDVFAIDLWDAPHVLAPGLQIIVGQTPAHGLTRDIVVLSEPDQLTREKLQRSAGAAFGRIRTGRRDQQSLLFAGELTIRSGTWLFAERCLQVAKHKAPLGPVHDRAAHPTPFAISSSLALASAASKICARLSLRTAYLPPLKSAVSSARSAWLSSTR